MRRVAALLKRCEKCDCGSHHGRSHVQATEFTVSKRITSDHVQTEGVTPLPADVEDTLRKAFADLFALRPIELLMVRHAMNGGTAADFGRHMRDFVGHFRNYLGGQISRQTAHALKESIVRKLPRLKGLMRIMADPNADVGSTP